MKTSNNYAYYILLISVFIGLKLWFSGSSNNNVYYLLKPIDVVISYFTNATSNYNDEFGFFYEKLNITIDKSCSGFNFLLLAFSILYVSILKVLKSKSKKVLIIPILFFIAYVFTLIVNISRILISIFIENKINISFSWLHEAEGVFIYASFLITLYISTNYIINKIKNGHEKYA